MSTTLMQFVIDQSSLPVGNTIEDHILNPASDGGIGQVISDLEGTVINNLSLSGVVETQEVNGTIDFIGIYGIIDTEEIDGVIQTAEIEGKINEC